MSVSGFSSITTDEDPREEEEVIFFTPSISLISLYIFSVIRLSISIGFAHGKTVEITTVQNFMLGDDSFGIENDAPRPRTIMAITIKKLIRYFLTQKPRKPASSSS